MFKQLSLSWLGSLAQHHRWILGSCYLVVMQLTVNILQTTVKTWAQLDWWDIAGEGGAALLVYAWFLMLVVSRPAGKVTNLFAAGFLLLFVGMFQDALDEVLVMKNQHALHNFLESLTLPVGMLLLTFGMYCWRNEQRVIAHQLKKREQIFRSHTSVDGVTQVHRTSYLKKYLALLDRQAPSQKPHSLVLIDICNFSTINRKHGASEGDRLLLALVELLILNLREQDLICRYAGDRFAILLAETSSKGARDIAQDLLSVVAAFAFHTRNGTRCKIRGRAAIACTTDTELSQLMEKAGVRLKVAKASGQEIVWEDVASLSTESVAV